MDLHKVFLNRQQKPSMGPYIPHPFSTEYFNPTNLGEFSTAFHPLNKSHSNMPHKSFSYPNCFNSFNKSMPEQFINKTFGFTKDLSKFQNLPAMSLTCIVGGFVPQEGMWNATQQDCHFDNPIHNIMNELVSKSMEITRTMSCPDPFNFTDPIPSKAPPFKEDPITSPVILDNPTSSVKLTYADVTKMNLSGVKKSSPPSKPSSNNLSSHKNGVIIPGKGRDFKIVSPPQGKNGFTYRKNGTSHYNKTDREACKPKCHNITKPNNRRLQNKKHSSHKRELGTKKNNQNIDLDGSLWSRDDSEPDMIVEECVTLIPNSPSSLLIRLRSISTDSECSSEQSECVKYPRARTLSECSINSIDSDDSFIVFDYGDDRTADESCEDDSSSDETDECISVVDGCSGVVPQAAYLRCVNTKWNNLSDKKNTTSVETAPCRSVCPLTATCEVFKKVRFACGEALAKVHKLCVWDYAHRAARVGPWEQAARDRARFSSKISSIAQVLNPVLDPVHRSSVYNQRFAVTDTCGM